MGYYIGDDSKGSNTGPFVIVPKSIIRPQTKLNGRDPGSRAKGTHKFRKRRKGGL